MFGGRTGASAPTALRNEEVRRGGALLPTVVPTGSRPLSWPPIGALPRNRLASSATGGASAISPPAGGVEPRPYGSVYKECDFYRPGRCGERTERCRWQRKRSERVAAVKILSVRRKAARKFWAPQQDHRPLRGRCKECNTDKGRPGGPPLRFLYSLFIYTLRRFAENQSPRGRGLPV